MSEILLTEQASGVTPGAGKRTVYVNADGALRVKDSAGVEYVLMKVGAAINDTPIGQTTAAAGSFTTLTATGVLSGMSQTLIKKDVETAYGYDGTGQGVGVYFNDAADELRVYNRTGGSNIARFGRLGDLSVAGSLSSTGALTTASLKEDAAGNLGLGVVPSAWGAGIKALQIGARAAVWTDGGQAILSNNMAATPTGDKYLVDGYAGLYTISPAGAHSWLQAPSGTAGAPITFTQAATLDQNGNWLVGAASGSNHVLKKSVTPDVGAVILSIEGTGQGTAAFFSVSGGSLGNVANSAFATNKDGTTGRSINSAGTINASGADYAEYERNNGLTFAKGEIVGFKADGTLTNVYADAVRFAVKSTNPSYVGGDTWGNEDAVGKRPDEPQFTPSPYTGSLNPGDAPAAPVAVAEDATQDVLDAYAAALTVYESASTAHAAALHTYTMDMAQHTAFVAVAKALFDSATYPEYERAKAAFEARLEAARQLVDRIAYSGKVPCNVQGAAPGDYILAAPTLEGGIHGFVVTKADMTFDQYQDAVGRVNRLLPDGRCEVAVIIH